MVQHMVLCTLVRCNSYCWGAALGVHEHISCYAMCRRWSFMWHKDCMIPMRQTVRSPNRFLLYMWLTDDSL